VTDGHARGWQALCVIRVGAAGAPHGLLVAAIHPTRFAKVQRTENPLAIRASQRQGLQAGQVIELPACVRGALAEIGVVWQPSNLALETRALHSEAGRQ
jgi:hypothetical protein